MAGQLHTFEYSIKFAADTTGLRSVITEIDRIAERARTVDMSESMKKATTEAGNLRRILNDAWDPRLNRFSMNKVNKEIKRTYGSIQQFRTEMRKAGNEGAMMFDVVAQHSMTTAMQVRQHSSIITKFMTSLKSHVRWFISSSITQTVVGSISKAYNFTKDLDKALNDIRIVTGKNRQEMAEFAKYAQKAAFSLHTSTKSYAEASLIYYQQGLSNQEVQARTNTTMKVANVTGMDAETASEQLTAVWNGYQVSLAETEAYIDKLSKVASTTASDLEELSTSMGKVASTANSVGVDIDQLTAQLSTIISVTRQSPESIGNALKTIYARMGDLKVDGEDESGVSLGKVSSTMKELGINILDQKGELRDLGSVIEETMSKWNGWTKAQKNAAAIVMAGTRQYNNLYALFENQDKYNHALIESKSATGALQKQQEIYEDSTTAKLQELSAAAEKLYSGLFDQEGIKIIVSGFTWIIDTIGNFVKGLNGGITTLMNFGNIVTLVFKRQIAEGVQTASSNIRGYFHNLRSFRANSDQMDSYARVVLNEAGITRNLPEPTQEQIASGRAEQMVSNYERTTEDQITNDMANRYMTFSRNKAFMSPQERHNYTEQMRELAEAYRQRRRLNFYQEYENYMQQSVDSPFEGVDFEDPDEVEEAYRERLYTLNSFINGTYQAPESLRTFRQTHLNGREININNLTGKQSASIFGVYNQSLKSGTAKAGEVISTDQAAAARNQALQNLFATYEDEIEQAFKAAGRYNQNKFGFNAETLRSNKNRQLILSVLQREEANLPRELTREQALTERSLLNRALHSRNTATADTGSQVYTNEDNINALEARLRASEEEAQKRATIGKRVNMLSSIGMVVTNTVGAFQTLISSTATLSDKVQAFGSALTSTGMQLGYSFSSFGSPFLGAITSGLSAIIGAGLQLWASWEREAEERLRKSAQAFEEGSNKITQISDNLSSIQQYKTEYETLAQGVGKLGQNLSLTNSQYDRFIELSNILGSKFPELINGYDEQGNAIIATNDAFNDLSSIIEQQTKAITTITSKGLRDYVKTKREEESEEKEDIKSEQTDIRRKLISYMMEFSDLSYEIDGKDVEQYLLEAQNGDLSEIPNIIQSLMKYKGMNAEGIQSHLQKLLDFYNANADILKKQETVQNLNAQTYQNDIIDKALSYSQQENTKLITDPAQQNIYKAILGTVPEDLTDKNIEAYAAETEKFIAQLTPEQVSRLKDLTSNKNLKYADFFYGLRDLYQDFLKTHEPGDLPSWMQGSLTPRIKVEQNGISEPYRLAYYFDEEQQKTFEKIKEDFASKFNMKTDEQQEQLQKFLEEKLTVKDLENYSDLSNLFGLNWNTIDNFETGKAIIDSTEKTTQSLETPQAAYKAVNSVIQYVMDADEKVKSGKELSDEDLKNIYNYNGSNEKALNLIEKMKAERDKKSQKFADLLTEYLQTLEDLSINSAVNASNIAYETLETNLKVLNKDLDDYELNFIEIQSKWLELGEDEFIQWLQKDKQVSEEKTVKLVADLSNFNATMDSIKEAEYEKTVTIKADVQSDFNQGFEVINKMVSLSEILSKGLTINISDIQKLVEQGYGAILENATAAANGQIVLNKEVVNTIVKAKQEEFATEIKIQQERNELKVKQLDAEIEIAELELEMLEKSLASEDTVEKAAYLAKAQMLENERKNIEDNYSIEWQNAKELTESQQQLATNLSNFMLTQRQSLTGEFLSLNASIDASNKAVAENQIGYYQQMGAAAQALIDQKWQRLKDIRSEELTKVPSFNDATDSDVAFEEWKKRLKKKNKELANSITSAEFNLMGGILENSGQDPEVMDAVTRSKIKVGSELVDSLKQSRAMYNGLNTAYEAGYSATTTGLENVQDAVGKTNDLLDDEIDRFHYLEKVIEKVSKVMSKLTDAQEKLIGTGLRENLQQQIALLQEENKLQERKREIAQNRANELRDTVAGYGAIFDNNGYIANYTELMTGILNKKNSMTTQYNAMSKADQDINKKLYDQEQKKLEHAEKIISQFEESISKDEEAAEQIYQNNNDRIEKQIADMKVMSDLYLDIAEIQDNFREYRSTVIDRVGERDYQKKIENAIEDLASGERKVQIHQQRLAELLEQERQMEATGTSSEYGDNEAQLREDIKEETSSLMDLQKSNVESINNAFTALTQGLEDTFAVVNDFYSNQQAELDFRLKLINLLGGSSVLQERIYNQQAEYYKGQLEAAKQETKLWNDQLDKAKQSNATEDQIRELTDKANEARKKENDLVISSIESLKNNYQSLIKSKLDEGFKSINDLQDQYNWTKTLNEPWLDDTTRMYEIQKFQLSVQSEIDNTASESAQKRLNEVMEEQLDILRTKDQLTKNDVDRANKIFDITKKQIALEEARQNKTRMRLRRDSQGNYNFQYVANEGEIQEKEKDLLASTQDFYDSQKEYSKKSLEDAFAFVKQYREEVEKVYLDETLSEEEKNQKVATMREQAEQHILALAIESKYAQEMLLKDLYEYSLPALYTANSQNFIDSINVKNSALKDWGALYVNEWMSACNVGNQTLQSLTNASVDFYQNLSDLDKTILVETVVPEFTEAVQTLMDKFTEPDGFNDVTNFAFTECERLSREYAQALNDLGNTAGYNFTQIHNGTWEDINDKEQVIQKIRTTNAELQTQIEKYTSLSSKIDDVNTSFTNFANNSDILVKGSVDTLAGWTDTFSNLSRMHRAFIQDFVDGKNVFSGKWPGIEWSSAMTDALNASAQKVAETQKVINNAPTEGKYVTNEKKPTKTAKDDILSNGEKAVLRSMSAGELKSDNGIHNYWKSILASRSGHQVILYRVKKGEHGDGWKILDVNTAPNSYIIDQERNEIIYDEASYQYGPMILKGKQLIEKLLKPGSYDTGGYTGAWHSQEGKWAILHEKELVLNKDDTRNLLSTIKLTRGFASTIQNIETNLADHLNQLQNKMTSSFENINVQTARQSEQQGVQQHFTVNASFPNVESVNDIKEAFKYLSTYGQQYINRRY